MNPTSSESTLTFEKLKDVVKQHAPQPFRWMVRRADLPIDQGLYLDLLGLPERVQPSELLPDGVIAVIFEEEPGHAFPRTFSQLWVVRDPEKDGLPATEPEAEKVEDFLYREGEDKRWPEEPVEPWP